MLCSGSQLTSLHSTPSTHIDRHCQPIASAFIGTPMDPVATSTSNSNAAAAATAAPIPNAAAPAAAAPAAAAPAAKKRERAGWRENVRRDHKAAQAEKNLVRAMLACALVLLILSQ